MSQTSPPFDPERLNLPPGRAANTVETCRWFGVSGMTLRTWDQDGCPLANKSPKIYDLKAVCEWRIKKKFATPEGEFDPERLGPKERLDWYRGAKERLAYDVARGVLMDGNYVLEHWVKHITSVRGRLMGLAYRVSGVIAGLSDRKEIEREINAALERTLEELNNDPFASKEEQDVYAPNPTAEEDDDF